ncbi:RelA/SpoT domain-containing protein [Nocardioides sp. TRM66260-LWL]|uniref:RelA/SpoT domain-containing protein n=1 Tax=Nocardioides sp. TRM66260-LWL TaxID=2874478 RepID=UPI001CC8085C|nr:RelA/SpoT domain-containing protein [Nocardioides sp. TRM66260-LWL]MBZ5735032.1 RelA/SpoT domain-containing protein [Nocardioides sp. TRM66260-LWL]
MSQGAKLKQKFHSRSMTPEMPSGNQIDKAGKYLRDIRTGRIPSSEVDPEKRERSVEIVTTFREAHAAPMNSIRMGLESMNRSLQLGAAISQRHKRVPRIVRKLTRMNGTGLSRLEDIGGCRVVVADIAQMQLLGDRIRKRWAADFVRPPRDYVAGPKSMGYRAHHYVVRRHGRAIEVQVRTQGQQRWADAVEQMDARWLELGAFLSTETIQLKDEIGPTALRRYFELAAEIIWLGEAGLPIPPMLHTNFIRARTEVINAGYYSA